MLQGREQVRDGALGWELVTGCVLRGRDGGGDWPEAGTQDGVAHNELHLLQVGHGSVWDGAVLFKCLFSNIQLAGHLETQRWQSGQLRLLPFAKKETGWKPGTLKQMASGQQSWEQAWVTWPWAYLVCNPGGSLQLHGGDVLGPSVPAAWPLWRERAPEGRWSLGSTSKSNPRSAWGGARL